MALDVTGGIPRGRPSRKMPAPFKRPRIEVGRKVADERRDWQWVSPMRLVSGDVVPGLGIVTSIRELVYAPEFESGLSADAVVEQTVWRVVVAAGAPNSSEHYLDPTQQVWAFARR